MKHITLALTLSLLLTGCNAVFLRETERFSLTLEGKPDATEPVSGNFGYKQRVAIVVPGRKKLEACDSKTETKIIEELKKDARLSPAAVQAAERALGESVSVISYYDMTKTRGGDWLVDPIDIRTAFITGEAASSLDTTDTKRATAALTGGALGTGSLSDLSMLRLFYTKLSKSDDARSKTLLASLDGLATQAPKAYAVNVYEFDNTTGKLKVTRGKGSAVAHANFDKVLSFAENLSNSAESVAGALKESKPVAIVGSDGVEYATNPADVTALQAELAATNKEIKSLNAALFSSAAVSDLVASYQRSLFGKDRT